MKRWFSMITLALVLAGCGGAAVPTAQPTAPAGAADLGAIKTYLVGKATDLDGRAAKLESASQRYYDLAKAANFDYAALWSGKQAEVSAALVEAKQLWTEASPNYEQIEGIVAGVPTLADYDVILDAGSSGAEGGDSVAPYDLTLADGRTLAKPGNLFGVTESTLWGTFPEFTVADVQADLNGNGSVEFGESLPEANVLLASTQKLHATTGELLTAAQAWQPTEADAFTALVTMIPTMSEYFESWKNSRFVSGDASEQRDFVAISRLADVQDILGSLQVVYTSVSPAVAKLDKAEDEKIAADLAALRAFVADVHAKEKGGQRFTAEEADILGAEAQNRATAVTGQISQVAARLNVKIAE
ncbi:MAG TPA: imelysin family protein [Herpetosiphonaceae bacterium]|nr:imelysin family protein [Herpetosiphonaceae bacterium]